VAKGFRKCPPRLATLRQYWSETLERERVDLNLLHRSLPPFDLFKPLGNSHVLVVGVEKHDFWTLLLLKLINRIGLGSGTWADG